jgi:methylmalonic aciduria homocystinuria type C protein
MRVEQLAAAGLDVVLPFDPAAYTGGIALPPGAVAVLVGNSRALWPQFVAALDRDSDLAASGHPLDRYVEQAVAAALDPDDAVRFAHHADPDFLPMIDVARAAGLKIGACGLAIHPVFGPWIALRAVVGTAVAPPTATHPVAGCDCATGCGPPSDVARAAAGWRPDFWLAARDGCPVGCEHRYGDAQLRYHYHRDRSALYHR